jgi:hypothetical protein
MGGSLCIYYATILPLPIDTAAADDRRSTIDEQNKKQHNMIDNDYDPENDGETCDSLRAAACGAPKPKPKHAMRFITPLN